LYPVYFFDVAGDFVLLDDPVADLLVVAAVIFEPVVVVVVIDFMGLLDVFVGLVVVGFVVVDVFVFFGDILLLAVGVVGGLLDWGLKVEDVVAVVDVVAFAVAVGFVTAAFNVVGFDFAGVPVAGLSPDLCTTFLTEVVAVTAKIGDAPLATDVVAVAAFIVATLCTEAAVLLATTAVVVATVGALLAANTADEATPAALVVATF